MGCGASNPSPPGTSAASDPSKRGTIDNANVTTAKPLPLEKTEAALPGSASKAEDQGSDRRDRLQQQRDSKLNAQIPPPGAVKLCSDTVKHKLSDGEWSVRDRTAGGMQRATNPQYALLLSGASSASVSLHMRVVSWGASVSEYDKCVYMAIYRQGSSKLVSRLHSLPTEDRVEGCFYNGDEISLPNVELACSSAYVIVCMASGEDTEGEGLFVLEIEATGACFELWHMPVMVRHSAENGQQCKEALARHHRGAVENTSSSPSIGNLLYETCPVDDVIRELGDAGFFIDDQFPPSAASLNKEPQNAKTVEAAGGWARVGECCNEPALYVGGVNPDDVIQGQIGNCWFVAYLAVLGLFPELAQSLIYPSVYSPHGVYAVRVWHRNTWKWLLVDDWVPVDCNGQPQFIRSRSGNEIWMVVLEKAYAKLHGSYQMMRGSFRSDITGRCSAMGSEVLRLLTAGDVQEVSIEEEEPDKVFGLLQRGCVEGALAALATRHDCDHGQSGLVPNHAYSVLRACVTKEAHHQLLQLRNTWGGTEWSLKWSDIDKTSWTSSLRRELCFTPGDDGVFWMETSDFVRRYASIDFCKLVPSRFPSLLSGAAGVESVMTPSRSQPNMSQPYPFETFRIAIKSRWDLALCGGLDATDNPQVEVIFDEGAANCDREARTLTVALAVPSLTRCQGFSATLGLAAYKGSERGAAAPQRVSGAASEDRARLIKSTNAEVSCGGSHVVNLELDSVSLCDCDTVILIPQIATRLGEAASIAAEFRVLISASHPVAPRRLPLPPPPTPAPPPALLQLQLAASAAQKIAALKASHARAAAGDEARLANAKKSLTAYGLAVSLAAFNPATASSTGIELPCSGDIPYQLPTFLTAAMGYPSLDELVQSSMGLKPRTLPGISLTISHVVAGFQANDRNLRLLRAGSDANGRCFAPANSILMICWDFVAGDFLGDQGRFVKGRDHLVLIKAAAEDDSVDSVWSDDLAKSAARDSLEVTLPIEMEYGAQYEFRYMVWSASSTFGHFSGARSQPLMIVPRAGVDSDGWLSISSTHDVTEDGVTCVATGSAVEVQWSIAELAGITDESRAYFREHGTKNFEDFIAVYDANETDTSKYAYYFDVPEADTEAGCEAEQRLTLEPYYLEQSLSSGATYVVRYIRERNCVAESERFTFGSGQGDGEQQPSAPQCGGDETAAEAKVEAKSAAAGSSFRLTGSGTKGFTAHWTGVPEPTDSDFLAVCFEGDDPYYNNQTYEYATGAASGNVSFGSLEELGIEVSDAATIMVVVYVSGESGETVGTPIQLQLA